MDNVLLLARDLQMKIQSNEDSAHKVLSNALHLQDIIHYTNEYHNNVDNVNKVSGRNYTSIYTNQNLTPADRSHFAKLQKENTDLKTTLDDYQTALELIMTKYRQQMGKLIESQKIDTSLSQIRQCEQEVQQKNQQISQMISTWVSHWNEDIQDFICHRKAKEAKLHVMNTAASSDDQISLQKEEEIVALKVENEGLKSLLGIAETGVMDEEMIETSRENTLLRPPKMRKSYSDVDLSNSTGLSFGETAKPLHARRKLRVRDSMEELDMAMSEGTASDGSSESQDTF